MLGYVRPGEHLFIVKGIEAWEKAHSRIGGEWTVIAPSSNGS